MSEETYRTPETNGHLSSHGTSKTTCCTFSTPRTETHSTYLCASFIHTQTLKPETPKAEAVVFGLRFLAWMNEQALSPGSDLGWHEGMCAAAPQKGLLSQTV